MDPVSLATAVITIGSFAATSAKFVRSLDEARRFHKDVKKISRNFRMNSSVVEGVSITLGDLSDNNPESKVVRWITQKGLAADIAETSRDLRDKITAMQRQLEDAAEGGFLGKLWWTLMHKPEILKLYPEVESLKLSLLMVQHNIMYEITSDVKKRKRLRQAMKQLETTLVTLREEHLSEKRKLGLGAAHPDRSVTSLALETNELLLELSRSMRRREQVPEIPSEASHTKTARHSRRPPDPGTLREDAEMLVRPRINPQPPPQQLRRTRPVSTQIREEADHRSRPKIVIPESALQRFEANTVAEGSDDHAAEARRDSTVSAKSTVPTRADSSSSSSVRSTPETPITPLTPPAPAAESSFTDVRESRNYHSLVGLEGEAIQGYLGTRVGESHLAPKTRVVAHRFREALDENFITVRKARESDLDIEPSDPETEVVVLEVAKGTRLPVVGTVEATWSSSTSYPPKFRLKMWVVDGQLPDKISIALGRPFEKRNRYYKSAPSVSERDDGIQGRRGRCGGVGDGRTDCRP